MKLDQFEKRKTEHLHYALDLSHQATQKKGFEQVHLIHEALPEWNWEEVDFQSHFLGHSLKTPFFIAGMTAGHPQAQKLNQILAQGCQKRGWIFGLGSQRRGLLDDQGFSLKEWLALREQAPEVVLLANIGMAQVIKWGPIRVLQLAKEVKAQGLAIHCNSLQEALQKEGTPQFKGGLKKLEECILAQEIPILLKETGCGFSQQTLKRIAQKPGLAALDVSGLGGTHWGRIEGSRAGEGSVRHLAAQVFKDWGEPTLHSLRAAVDCFQGSGTEIWASGGMRSGLDAAKCFALGAHRVGYAQPALVAGLAGKDALEAWMEEQEFELKLALWATGAGILSQLRNNSALWRWSVPLSAEKSEKRDGR